MPFALQQRSIDQEVRLYFRKMDMRPHVYTEEEEEEEEENAH